MNNQVINLFSTEEDGVKFNIAFDKIFEKEKFQVFNAFNLSSKRNFKMIANLIKETYENLFTLEDGALDPDMEICLLQILNVQSKIMKRTGLPLNDFIQLLYQIIHVGNNTLYNKIDKFIESGYALTLDENTKKMKEKNKNVNDQIVISDSYAKILLKIAYLDRVMIPLISQFFMYNKDFFPAKAAIVQSEDDEGEEMIFSEINQTIFDKMFEVFAKDDKENIQNKLYKLVYARIIRTAFSSNKFWTVAKTVGMSKESACMDIYLKLLSNSVPKLILDKDLNIVNFFSVIINNQIVFLFSNKFKTHYQLVSHTSDSGSLFESNDDSMTDMEKMEIQLSHKDEGGLIINNTIASDVISKIDTLMDVSVTKEEINDAVSSVHKNPIQERVVAMLTYKYFKGTEAIKRLTAYEYAKLLICCKKYLMKQKFILLPKIIMSRCAKQRDRVAITGVKIKSKIEDSKRYKELMQTKYKAFKYDAERNIQSLISTIYSSTFIDDAGNDVFETSSKIGNVAEEIVDLCYLI